MICLNCKVKLESRDKRTKFCSRSCSTTFNNLRRVITNSHRENIANSLKKYYEVNPTKMRGWEHAQAVGRGTKGKYNKTLKTIYDVSSRTRAKIIARLNLKCCVCGWDEDSIDIHHILPRKDGGSDDLANLTPLCPNHHRLADKKKLSIELLIPLSIILPHDWSDQVYFG
jgi:hypothetical protein